MNAASIRPARDADLALVRDWLAAAGLPTNDLTTAHMQDFMVAMIANRAAGMIGLEQFGAVGLLRSLIVAPDQRSSGVGKLLVDALETAARQRGIKMLWLLTIDADAYFLRCGYAQRERREAPAAIKATKEFASLCPDDAVLMSKAL